MANDKRHIDSGRSISVGISWAEALFCVHVSVAFNIKFPVARAYILGSIPVDC